MTHRAARHVVRLIVPNHGERNVFEKMVFILNNIFIKQQFRFDFIPVVVLFQFHQYFFRDLDLLTALPVTVFAFQCHTTVRTL